MRKFIKQCDEEEAEGQEMNVANFKLSIWAQQLENFREIVINEDITDNLLEMATLQVININRYDDQHEAELLAAGLSGYEREPIKILINTGGGELHAALSLCAAIETSKTPVHTVALGQACSAGFLILICGHKRYAQQYSRLMYHTGSSGYVGVITVILEHGDYLASLNEMIQTIVQNHTNITEEQLDDVFMRKTDWYLTIGDALELGVIDGIYGMSLPPEGDDECDSDCLNCDQEDCKYNPRGQQGSCGTCE